MASQTIFSENGFVAASLCCAAAFVLGRHIGNLSAFMESPRLLELSLQKREAVMSVQSLRSTSRKSWIYCAVLFCADRVRCAVLLKCDDSLDLKAGDSCM